MLTETVKKHKPSDHKNSLHTTPGACTKNCWASKNTNIAVIVAYSSTCMKINTTAELKREKISWVYAIILNNRSLLQAFRAICKRSDGLFDCHWSHSSGDIIFNMFKGHMQVWVEYNLTAKIPTKYLYDVQIYIQKNWLIYQYMGMSLFQALWVKTFLKVTCR